LPAIVEIKKRRLEDKSHIPTRYSVPVVVFCMKKSFSSVILLIQTNPKVGNKEKQKLCMSGVINS